MVQGQMGRLMANHAPNPDRGMIAGGDEAKRAFAAMIKMSKIDVSAIDAARRGK